MQSLNRFITVTSVASEVTHMFCCGIPMIFSVLSFLTSAGLMASMPSSLEHIHHVMHDYEIPMIAISALLITTGWVFHYISKAIDCRKDGDCSHAPCSTKKKRSSKILMLATFLFILNVTGYFLLHH